LSTRSDYCSKLTVTAPAWVRKFGFT